MTSLEIILKSKTYKALCDFARDEFIEPEQLASFLIEYCLAAGIDMKNIYGIKNERIDPARNPNQN